MKNIHTVNASQERGLQPASTSDIGSNASLPRLRSTQNDPLTEFNQRPGAIVPLPDSIHALILHRQRFEKVGRDGIKFTEQKKTYHYWSENSVACLSMVDQKVLITFNRHNMDVIHVLTEDGEYIETIPQKSFVNWFDQAATAKELARTRHVISQTQERLAHLHTEDTQEAVERAQHNASVGRGVHAASTDRRSEESSPAKRWQSSSPGREVPPLSPVQNPQDGISTKTQRIVTTFPVEQFSSTVDQPVSDSSPRSSIGVAGTLGDSQPAAPFFTADRIVEAEAHAVSQRANHKQYQSTARDLAKEMDEALYSD